LFLQLSELWPEPGDDEGMYSLSIILRERYWVKDVLRSRMSTCGEHLLPLVCSAIVRFFASAAASGYHPLLVTAGTPDPVDGTTERSCEPTPDLRHALDRLIVAGRDALEAAYPIAVWGVPSGNGDAARTVSAFRALPHDPALWANVLAAGVFRLDLNREFADVLAAPELGGRIATWMRTAITQVTGVPVEWKVWSV